MKNTIKKAAGALNINSPNAQVNVFILRIERAAKKAYDGNAIARFAFAGHIVHKDTHDDFVICKKGLSRWSKDFSELQAFASRLVVQHVTN